MKENTESDDENTMNLAMKQLAKVSFKTVGISMFLVTILSVVPHIISNDYSELNFTFLYLVKVSIAVMIVISIFLALMAGLIKLVSKE
jgi:hypothetical protein